MKYLACIGISFFFSVAVMAQTKHVFSLNSTDFLLDGKPLQMISGEMHPARIPREYWRNRIQMAKAMGCNTIAVYVFWNYQETTPGQWDFRSGNKDIAAFIKMCKEEGMWVLLRPGPYVCAEWDFGGLPAYLLKTPDIKIRCLDPTYMQAVGRYISRLSKEIAPLQCTNGGPILMVQIENEYGSYANDKNYLLALKKLWLQNGITVPFYTADGPTDYMLEAGNIEYAAIGLDSGGSDADFETAHRNNSKVPSFSSETYPGWLTHFKEAWQKPDTTDLLREVKYLLENKKSFNLYVIHGGTNFGFTAGANAFTPTQYQPDVTSYDYDAPINEQGQPTPKYFALRRLISQYVHYTIPPVPAGINAITIPAFQMEPFTSIWQQLPAGIASPQPRPMEYFNQSNGLIVYRTTLIGHHSGKLTITEPHDYAIVLLNGKLVDTIFRDGGKWTIELPKTDTKNPVLDILVESMGHINFAQYMIDRKGITDRVTLNGMTLMNWQIFPLPMQNNFVQQLQPTSNGDLHDGVFFKGNITINNPADTYLDMSKFKKGMLWVNGHNLGRYWNTGPQFKLFCPGVWLKKGNNQVIVFDFHQQQATTIKGEKTLE
ncbi:glycoside hydrolase family 35 protein [Limnovirga soli]|uniref:Beta-galactosidase n=1 Tax=Limnovirga soli TaxID=2656915 RepID=A0A8J8FCW3_9BACT|nr:beta-galactosidase family protein [Limnovirga soli]NNV55678.1 beta-galactosidase [Limnovirga soli]